MATRCPKCGRNNYGDTNKCSFCGSSLKFAPGEEIPQIKDEDVQQKIKRVKAKRLRNPTHIGAGGIVMVIGALLAFAIFLIFMFLIFTPTDVTASYERGAWHYNVPGGKEILYGKITARASVGDSGWPDGSNHGYINHTAYEIGGDGRDRRAEGHKDGMVGYEPHTWVYSKIDLGSKGDSVLITVKTEQNAFGESRAVVEKKHGNGLLSGWWLFAPGLLILVIGSVILTIGLIGKPDRSLERLMEEDQEFRRQQLAMMQAARNAAIEKQKQSRWDEGKYNQALQEAERSRGDISQELAVLEADKVQGPEVMENENPEVQTTSSTPAPGPTAPPTSDAVPVLSEETNEGEGAQTPINGP